MADFAMSNREGATVLPNTDVVAYNYFVCHRNATMPTRFLRAVLPSLLVCGLGMPLAHAEIYTWVDPAGVINLSNLAPPDGVRVTRVTHDPPPRVASASEAAREAARQAELQALADRAKELEVQALSERVRQLEREVEIGRIQASAPVAYPVMPSPPVVQYAAEPAPPAYTGCDPSWSGCGLWWGSGIYPGVVVVGVPGGRRFHHPFRGGQNPVMPRPMPFFSLQPLRLSSAPSAGLRGVPHRR